MRRTSTLQYLLLLPAVLICISVRVMGQEAAHCVSGIIVSDTENKPLEYVEVLLSDTSYNTRASVLTDDGGAFMAEAESGTYIFSYRLLGETLRADTVNIDSDIDLGIISLPMINKDIGEVTVTGKRAVITFDKDRLVYNVKNSPYANGFSAFDVIKYVLSPFHFDSDKSITGNRSDQAGGDIIDWQRRRDCSYKRAQIQPYGQGFNQLSVEYSFGLFRPYRGCNQSVVGVQRVGEHGCVEYRLKEQNELGVRRQRARRI